jgi:predicted phosphoribosyltransferase
MKAKLIVTESLKNKLYLFEDRAEAGRRLSKKLSDYKDANGIVLAIPSGGVPVAAEIARSLNLPMDLILVRKIQIPWNTEAGFGAIDPDGEAIFNEGLLKGLGLTEDEINQQAEKTRDILKKRNELFRAGEKFPEIKDKVVILVDDGIASGYTMLAALKFLKKKKPKKMIVAVPTGSLKTVESILPETDELICLNIRAGFPFAVADAYENWSDLTDEEVRSIIEQSKKNP